VLSCRVSDVAWLAGACSDATSPACSPVSQSVCGSGCRSVSTRRSTTTTPAAAASAAAVLAQTRCLFSVIWLPLHSSSLPSVRPSVGRSVSDSAPTACDVRRPLVDVVLRLPSPSERQSACVCFRTCRSVRLLPSLPLSLRLSVCLSVCALACLCLCTTNVDRAARSLVPCKFASCRARCVCARPAMSALSGVVQLGECGRPRSVGRWWRWGGWARLAGRAPLWQSRPRTHARTPAERPTVVRAWINHASLVGAASPRDDQRRSRLVSSRAVRPATPARRVASSRASAPASH